MKTYTLTAAEVARYDSGDDEINSRLSAELLNRFGPLAAGEPVTTEVVHPDGYVISAHVGPAVTTKYALIDAEGHYGDWADVYKTYTTAEDARKGAYGWNRRGKHQVQIIEGEFEVGEKVSRRSVGSVYPRVSV
jgi:hypothetical protein